MKFRVELWRVVKFLLITLAVNSGFSIVNASITNALVTNPSVSTGQMLSLLSYAHTFLSALVLTLIHRYFSFRATEKWYIAVPSMMVAAFVWQFLTSIMLSWLGRALGTDGISTASLMISGLWMIVSYLLQRCVIYCHTTDQNGWYRRFHTDDKGE